MLNVQNWLRNNNYNFSALNSQLGIKAVFNDSDDRVILNYDQIESPKRNDIVRECRGLTLNKKGELVARAFSRFFNWGEIQHDEKWFVWENSKTFEKVDGSLITTYSYNGQYHMNTRGSFGNGYVVDGIMTWRELFNLAFPNWAEKIKAAGVDNLTLVWELCSKYNQVVRIYDEPTVYLLAAFSGVQEVNDEMVDEIAKELKVRRPELWLHNDVFDVFAHVNKISESDLTFEGCVVKDLNNQRWKIKAENYLRLHRLSNNNNIAHIKNLVPLILKGESAEIASYFPHFQPKIEELEKKIKKLRQEVDNIWFCHHDERSQKRFALAVKDHPLSAILFTARKTGRNVNEIFNESAELLIKVLL